MQPRSRFLCFVKSPVADLWKPISCTVFLCLPCVIIPGDFARFDDNLRLETDFKRKTEQKASAKNGPMRLARIFRPTRLSLLHFGKMLNVVQEKVVGHLKTMPYKTPCKVKISDKFTQQRKVPKTKKEKQKTKRTQFFRKSWNAQRINILFNGEGSLTQNLSLILDSISFVHSSWKLRFCLVETKFKKNKKAREKKHRTCASVHTWFVLFASSLRLLLFLPWAGNRSLRSLLFAFLVSCYGDKMNINFRRLHPMLQQ